MFTIDNNNKKVAFVKLLADSAAGQKLKIRQRSSQRACKSSRRMDVAVVIAVVVVVSTIPYRDNGVNEPHISTTAHSILSLCVCVLVRGCISQCEGLVLLVFVFSCLLEQLRL